LPRHIRGQTSWLKEGACTKCLECVRKCPAGALGEDGSLDLGKCMKISLIYGLPGVTMFRMKAVVLDKEELNVYIGRSSFG
jgi:ferredoxin